VKRLAIPADVEHWYLDQIAELIAYARNPQVDDDPEDVSYQLSLITANEQVNKAAADETLTLRHPATHGPFPKELGTSRAVVLPADVVAYLAGYGVNAVLMTPEQMAQVATAQEAATPAPEAANGKKWTPEMLAELKAYRDAHTMQETAAAFGISEQRIRQLLPIKKAKAQPFAGLIHRSR
jgi:hypothetical protein